MAEELKTNPRIEELKGRLSADPKSRLFYPLAEELRKIRQYEEAERVLRQGLETHAGYLSAWISLGRVLKELANHEEASQVLEKALSIDPENVVAARLAADNFLAMGDRVEAIKKFKLVRALHPADDEIEEIIDRLEGEIAGDGSLAETERVALPPREPETRTAEATDQTTETQPVAAVTDEEPSTDSGSGSGTMEMSAADVAVAPEPETGSDGMDHPPAAEYDEPQEASDWSDGGLTEPLPLVQAIHKDEEQAVPWDEQPLMATDEPLAEETVQEPSAAEEAPVEWEAPEAIEPTETPEPAVAAAGAEVVEAEEPPVPEIPVEPSWTGAAASRNMRKIARLRGWLEQIQRGAGRPRV